MAKTLTFETKTYEKDWQFIVKGGHLEQAINNCRYPFDRKVLYLNNFSNYDEVKREADKLVARNIIDEYVVVADHADAALKAFDIDKESFKGGYYYSIAELVSIYLTKTDYLLHFAGDSKLEDRSSTWINDGMELLDKNPKVVVANPVWNQRYDEAKQEALAEDDNWFYSYGFSDQCYLIQTKQFQQAIYNEVHPDSARYPGYGGELFEKRVDAYLRTHELQRATSKHVSYTHENFPKGIGASFQKVLKKLGH